MFEASAPSTGRLLIRATRSATLTQPKGVYGCTLVLRGWSGHRPVVELAAPESTYLAGPPTACSTLRRLPPRDL